MTNDAVLQRVKEGAGLEVLDDLEIRSPRTGRMVGRVGLRVSLKFRDGHTLDKRLAMVAMWRSYYETFREHLSHWQKPDATRLTKLGDSFPPFEQLAREAPPDKHFSGVLWGFPPEETTDQPAMYEIGAIGLKSLSQGKNSYMEAHIPTSWAVARGWDTFRELVRHWCDILSPVHGTAGLSLLFEPAMSSRNLKHAYGLLKRFPGLDVEEPGYFNAEVGKNVHKIRTINWLTVLGEPLIEEIGGRDTMRVALSDERPSFDCPLFDYEGGTIIQAGTQPGAGRRQFRLHPGDLSQGWHGSRNPCASRHMKMDFSSGCHHRWTILTRPRRGSRALIEIDSADCGLGEASSAKQGIRDNDDSGRPDRRVPRI